MGAVGGFNWVDLSTTDGPAAKAFYEGLFGWTSEDVDAGEGMTYSLMSSGDDVVAGLGEYAPQQKEQGLPPMWNSYVTVEDAAATVAKAKELGANVLMDAFDVMDAGKMAVLTDPAGAVFALWQDGNHAGAAKFNEPVSLTWNELATNDTDGSEAFYGNLFGWKADTQDTGALLYTTFQNGDQPNGGMFNMVGTVPEGIPPHWMTYFSVADTEDTAAKAQELGGELLNGPMDIPNVGKMAVLRDPQGGTFSVIQQTPQE